MANAVHIISKFGGVTALARRLDLTPSTVQGWKDRDSIPPERWKEILAAADECGVDLSIGDFLAPLGLAEERAQA